VTAATSFSSSASYAGSPRFSVMLPTYEPDEKLCRALLSVLAQAPPAEQMQISVVDDASERSDVAALVHAADPTGRVELIRHDRRLGLGGNWNRAIAAARGDLVHLLHQDDYVLPGFYASMDQDFRHDPQIGMAFCRCRIVDGDNRLIKTSSRLRWTPGTIHGWLPKIAERQRVQCPAAVVARSTYESVGGYRTDLSLALDWEMWVRIAARHEVGYEPRTLAAYCRHEANESARLAASGVVWPDLVQAIAINAASLPEASRAALVRRSAAWYAGSARRTAAKQLAQGNAAAARQTIAYVPRLLALAAEGDGQTAVARPAGATRRVA
jgi:glycosyltransferase involved in cell wall biosynthesis